MSCRNKPFGDTSEWDGPCTTSASYSAPQATEQFFTGKERDPSMYNLIGNDYFGARYYSSMMGRFLSPDWSAKSDPVPYAKLDNPQSLNLYGYMLNNPLAGVDQDEHCPWCIGAAIGVVAEVGFDLYTHQQITTRKIIGAALGGAIAGASGGLGLEEGLAIRATYASSGSIIAGVTERAIKTGSMNAAMQNPGAIVRDAVVGAAGSLVENGARAVVGRTERAAIQNLSEQSANTANRATKIAGRIERNSEMLATKQERVATTANVLSCAADKTQGRCGDGTCKK
jgi:RHS repeat-associated protein